jgi:hypothetical protein
LTRNRFGLVDDRTDGLLESERQSRIGREFFITIWPERPKENSPGQTPFALADEVPARVCNRNENLVLKGHNNPESKLNEVVRFRLKPVLQTTLPGRPALCAWSPDPAWVWPQVSLRAWPKPKLSGRLIASFKPF